MITDFKDKKLVEYLKDGQKVLIRFGHGLGDTLLFYPIFLRLKRMYRKIHFDLYVESGQEVIFPSIKDKDAKGYDHVFSLNFPMAEGTALTKPARCCIEEIGIPPITDVAELPLIRSPFIAVHFQGTALPGSVSCPEDVAQKIYQEIKDCGFIPIECHFEHVFHNPINKKYSFIENNVRKHEAKITDLIGLLQSCAGFIGIASGPFVTALSIMPERTLFLEKSHKLECYTTKKIPKIKLSEYKHGQIKTFLKSIQSENEIQKGIMWILSHYKEHLFHKATAKILWGNRSIFKKDWILIKQFLKLHPEIKTVLEYGCGLSTELLQLEGLEVTCLESGEWWADICRKAIGNKIIHYERGHLPEIKEKFDLAFVDGPQSGPRLEEFQHAKEHSNLIYSHDLDVARQPAISKEMVGEWKQCEKPFKNFFLKVS